MTPLSRSRLPWQAVVAATVLAALAALLVIAVMGGDDGADPGPITDASIELTPLDELGDGEPLLVPVSRPDGGEATTLAEELDGPAVVNFFAEWCAPCVAEMPDFQEVSEEVAGQVEFVGVAVDRTDNAARIVEQTGVTYPWFGDGKGDVANAAGVTNMPATLFVGADGEVVSLHVGALDADELREKLESELGVTVG